MPVPDATPARRLTDYERGQKDATIESRLVVLEEHKKNVNGQITRLANGQDAMNARLGEIVETLKVNDEVNARLEKIAQTSGATKLERWQQIGLLIGGGGVFVGIVEVAVQLLGSH